MVDEAHSLGVIGATGRGVAEHFDLAPGDIDILMGTLSKTFASCGGFIAGRRELIDILKYFAPGLVLYSAGISPVSTAAALAALRVLREEPGRVEKLRDNARFFIERARAAGLDTGLSDGSAVVPIVLHDDDLALRVVDELMEQDAICVHAMLYPWCQGRRPAAVLPERGAHPRAARLHRRSALPRGSPGGSRRKRRWRRVTPAGDRPARWRLSGISSRV